MNSSMLNRTEEWPRLCRSGMFQVEDQAGRITVSKASTPVYIALSVAGAAIVLPLLTGSIFMILMGLVFGGIFLVVACTNIGHTYSVSFAPDTLTFYGPFGDVKGHLSRDSMQQIAVKEVETGKGRTGRYYHQFIADTGWMNAFFCHGETKAAIQNNVLLSAFSQPVHLDLLQDSPSYDEPLASPTFTISAPQVLS